MSARVLVADGSDGPLYACIDLNSRYVEPGLGRSRFAAILHPFQFEERARVALAMAGGENVREFVK